MIFLGEVISIKKNYVQWIDVIDWTDSIHKPGIFFIMKNQQLI